VPRLPFRQTVLSLLGRQPLRLEWPLAAFRRGPARRRIKKPLVHRDERSILPRCHPYSAMPLSGRRVGLSRLRLEAGSRFTAAGATPTDRCCHVSLALCAGAYWRALEARGSVRRLTGPFRLVAAPACTNRWFSTPAPGVTRPDHSPYSDVARSLGLRRIGVKRGRFRCRARDWMLPRRQGSTSTPRCGACRCRGPCRG
jgi:hypothetical protein